MTSAYHKENHGLDNSNQKSEAIHKKRIWLQFDRVGVDEIY